MFACRCGGKLNSAEQQATTSRNSKHQTNQEHQRGAIAAPPRSSSDSLSRLLHTLLLGLLQRLNAHIAPLGAGVPAELDAALHKREDGVIAALGRAGEGAGREGGWARAGHSAVAECGAV